MIQQMTITFVRRSYILCSLFIAIVLGGCDKPDMGPKRSDHTAAHSHRFHPDVKRIDAAGTPASLPADSTPRAVTGPADINFENGPIGCPVLFVNGETITVPEVLEPVIDDLKAKADSMTVVAYRNHLFKTIAGQVDVQIGAVMLYQEAKKIYTDDKLKEAFGKEADRLVKDVITKRYGGVSARYETHLKSLDLTTDGIKERARRQAMINQFLHERFRPLIAEPTRRQLVQYYDTHPDEFTTQAKAELLLIERPLAVELNKSLLRATPSEIDQARERARQQLRLARQELLSGANFADVAKRYCKGVRAKAGGNWGEITPGILTGRWAKAADVLFTLQTGQVSDIIETTDALLLVKCGQATPARKITFQEAQQTIMEKLIEEEFNQRQNSYVQELLGKATIRKRPEFFQAVLAAAPRPAAFR